MRQVLTLLTLTFCIIGIPYYSLSQPTTLRLRIDLVDTCCFNPQHHTEWRAKVIAELFDANNNLLPPWPNSYTWYRDFCDGMGYGVWLTGPHEVYPDGHLRQPVPGCCPSCTHQRYKIYAQVVVDGLTLTSQELYVPDDGAPLQQTRAIGVDQQSETIGTFGHFGLFGHEPLDTQGGSFYNYPAPFTFGVRENTTQALKASQSVLVAELQRYHEWFTFSDVKNHHPFYIDRSFNSLTAMFRTFNTTISIKAELLEAPGATGGNIQFHDPWYIDFQDGTYGNNWRNRGMVEPRQFYPRSVGSGGFTPDLTTVYPEGPYPYSGVFLNQSFASGTYYSVGAPNPNTINGFTSYFVNWTGSNVQYQNASAAQTGVVFTNSGATATAKYKAHLGSSLATATGNNGQRTLVQMGSVHHLIYQSGGQVWYTRSTNFGATWSNEELVSGYTQRFAPNINPSIDVGSNGTVFVAYECPSPTNPSNRGLIVVEKPLNSAWSNVIAEEYAASQLRPVIAADRSVGNPERVLVVFKADGSNPGLWYRYWMDPIYINATKVNGTSAASRNPSLSWAGLAYEENNGIYYSACYWSSSFSFQPPQLVSTNYVNGRLVTNISNPSIASRGTLDFQYQLSPAIAWQAQDLVFSTYRPIFVRHPVAKVNPPVFVLSVFDWGTYNARGRTPSVAMYTSPNAGSENPDVSVVWQDDPSNPNGSYPNTVVVNKINGVWSAQATLGTSTASSSIAQGRDLQQTSSGGTLVAWTSTSGPPYALTASQRTNIGGIRRGPMAKVNSTSMDYARSVNVDLAGTGITGLSGVLMSGYPTALGTSN